MTDSGFSTDVPVLYRPKYHQLWIEWGQYGLADWLLHE